MIMQTGLFVAILVSYVQLSPAITMPVSGALCSAFSWPWVLEYRCRQQNSGNQQLNSRSVFYAHGFTTMLLFIVYGLFYRNNPQVHDYLIFLRLSETSQIVVDNSHPMRLRSSSRSIPSWGPLSRAKSVPGKPSRSQFSLFNQLPIG